MTTSCPDGKVARMTIDSTFAFFQLGEYESQTGRRESLLTFIYNRLPEKEEGSYFEVCAAVRAALYNLTEGPKALVKRGNTMNSYSLTYAGRQLYYSLMRDVA